MSININSGSGSTLISGLVQAGGLAEDNAGNLARIIHEKFLKKERAYAKIL